MKRTTIGTGTPWEERVGYARAVRCGSLVFVSGTMAADEGGAIAHVGDMYWQTVYALRKIERALGEAGATLADVVRTRLYVTDQDRWEEVARAHRELLGEVRPCATMIEVRRLAAPDALIEIEVDAVVGE